MSQSPVSVTLAGQSYELKVPASFLPREALHGELVRLLADAEASQDPMLGRVVWAAFLGVYAPQAVPGIKPLRECKWNVSAYGEAVYEALRASDVSVQEIVDAGLKAEKLNRQSLAPREHEVSEVAGN